MESLFVPTLQTDTVAGSWAALSLGGMVARYGGRGRASVGWLGHASLQKRHGCGSKELQRRSNEKTQKTHVQKGVLRDVSLRAREPS